MYQLIESFIHEALCRYESNQHKASIIYNHFKDNLSSEDKHELSINWSHYMINQMSTEKFGQYLKSLKEKYK